LSAEFALHFLIYILRTYYLTQLNFLVTYLITCL